MATNIPTNSPLQQQIDVFIAERASWLPTRLLQDLLRPIGQLIASGAAEWSLKEGRGHPISSCPTHAAARRGSHICSRRDQSS